MSSPMSSSLVVPTSPSSAAAERISDPRYQWFEKNATAYFRCRASDLQRALDRDETRRDLLQFFDTALFSNMFVLHDSTISPAVVTVSLGSPPAQEMIVNSTALIQQQQQQQQQKSFSSSGQASPGRSFINNNISKSDATARGTSSPSSPIGVENKSSILQHQHQQQLPHHHAAATISNRKRYLLFSRLGKERLTVESLSTRINIIELSSDLLGSASWMLRSVVFPLLSATPVHGSTLNPPPLRSGTAAATTGNNNLNNSNNSFDQHQQQQQQQDSSPSQFSQQLIASGCKRTIGGTFVASEAALHALTRSIRNIANALVPLVGCINGSVILSHTILQRRTPQLLAADQVESRDCLVGPDFAHLRELETVAKTWIEQLNHAVSEAPNFSIDDLYGPEGFFAACHQQAPSPQQASYSASSLVSNPNSSLYYTSQSDIVCPIRRPLNEIHRRRHRLRVLEQVEKETSSPIVSSARQELVKRNSPLSQPLEHAIANLSKQVDACRDDLKYVEPLIPIFRELDVIGASHHLQQLALNANEGNPTTSRKLPGGSLSMTNSDRKMNANANAHNSSNNNNMQHDKPASVSGSANAAGVVTTSFIESLASGLPQKKCFVGLGVFFARNDHMATSAVVGGLVRGVVEGILQKVLNYCSVEYLFNDNARDLVRRISLALQALKATKDALAFLIEVSFRYRQNVPNNNNNNSNNNNSRQMQKKTNIIVMSEKPWMIPPSMLFDRLDRLVERLLEVSKLCSKKSSLASDMLSALPGPAETFRKAVIAAEERRASAIQDFSREGLGQLGFLSTRSFDLVLVSLNETLATSDVSIANAAVAFAANSPLDTDTLDTLASIAPVFASPNLHELWFKVLEAVAQQWLCFARYLEDVYRTVRNGVSQVQATAEVSLIGYRQQQQQQQQKVPSNPSSSNSQVQTTYIPAVLISDLVKQLSAALTHTAKLHDGIVNVIRSSPIDIETVLNIDLRERDRTLLDVGDEALVDAVNDGDGADSLPPEAILRLIRSCRQKNKVTILSSSCSSSEEYDPDRGESNNNNNNDDGSDDEFELDSNDKHNHSRNAARPTSSTKANTTTEKQRRSQHEFKCNPRFAGAVAQVQKLRQDAETFNYFSPHFHRQQQPNESTTSLAQPPDETQQMLIDSLSSFLFKCEPFLLLLQEDQTIWTAVSRNFRISAVLAQCFKSVVQIAWKYCFIQAMELRDAVVVKDLNMVVQLRQEERAQEPSALDPGNVDDETKIEQEANQTTGEDGNGDQALVQSPSSLNCCWVPGISDDDVCCSRFIAPLYRLIHATNGHLQQLFLPPVLTSASVPRALDEIANTEARLSVFRGLLARYAQLSGSLDDASRSLLKVELDIVADLILKKTGTTLTWRQTREIEVFFARLDIALQTVASVTTFLVHSPTALEETFRRLSSVGRFQIFPLAVQEPRAITAGDAATADLLGVVHTTPPFFVELAQFREMCDDAIACTRGALSECAKRFAQLISDRSLDALNEIKVRNGLPPISSQSLAWSAVVERSAKRVQAAYEQFACLGIQAITSQLTVGCLGGRQHLFDLVVLTVDSEGAKLRRRLANWMAAAWDAVTTGGTSDREWMRTCRGILKALDVYFEKGFNFNNNINNNNNNNNNNTNNNNDSITEVIHVEGVNVFDDDDDDDDDNEDDYNVTSNSSSTTVTARAPSFELDEQSNLPTFNSGSFIPSSSTRASFSDVLDLQEEVQEQQQQQQQSCSETNKTSTAKRTTTKKFSLLVTPSVSVEVSAVFLRSAILYNYGFAREFAFTSRKSSSSTKDVFGRNDDTDNTDDDDDDDDDNDADDVNDKSNSTKLPTKYYQKQEADFFSDDNNNNNNNDNNGTNSRNTDAFDQDDDDDEVDERERNLTDTARQRLRQDDPDFLPKDPVTGKRPQSFAVRCRRNRAISLETQELNVQLEAAQDCVEQVLEALLGSMHRLWSCLSAEQVLREEVDSDLAQAGEAAKANYQQHVLLLGAAAPSSKGNESSSSSSPSSLGVPVQRTKNVNNTVSNNNNNVSNNDKDCNDAAPIISQEKKHHMTEAFLEVECLGTTFTAIHGKLRLYQRASQSIIEDVPDMVLVQDWFRLDFRKIRARMRELASGVEACLCEHTFSQLSRTLESIESLMLMLDKNILENKERALEQDDDNDELARSDGLNDDNTKSLGRRLDHDFHQHRHYHHHHRANDALLTIVQSLRQIENHRQSVPKKFPILASVINMLLQHASGKLRADCLQTEVRLADLPRDWDNAIRRALSARDALSGRIQAEQIRLAKDAEQVNDDIKFWQTSIFMTTSPATGAGGHISFADCFERDSCCIVPSVFDLVYQDLDRHYQLLQSHYEHLLEIRNLQKVYDAVPTPLDVVNAARNDVVEAKHLWDFISHAVTEIHSWLTQFLRSDKTATLPDKARYLRESLFARRSKHLRDWPIFRQVDERLRFLYASFPSVHDIAIANLKERHWEDLRRSCGTPSARGDVCGVFGVAGSASEIKSKQRTTFYDNKNSATTSTNKCKTVGELVAFDLPSHSADMGRILEQAEKESQIEKALDEICSYWDTAAVPVLVPPFSLNAVRMRSEALSILLARGISASTSSSLPATSASTSSKAQQQQQQAVMVVDFDCALLVGADEMVELAQEHISRIQSMISSRWAAVFLKTLEKYQGVISEAETALAAWADVQRQWLSLRPIYAAGSDLLQQLPQHADHFKTAENQFIDLTKPMSSPSAASSSTSTSTWTSTSTSSLPRVVDICNTKFEMVLLRLADEFQHCEHGLARFLANKRQRFSRFYFLSDSDLIDLLASAHDPKRACCTHIGRIIEAVQTVTGISKMLELQQHNNNNNNNNNHDYFDYNNQSQNGSFFASITTPPTREGLTSPNGAVVGAQHVLSNDNSFSMAPGKKRAGIVRSSSSQQRNAAANSRMMATALMARSNSPSASPSMMMSATQTTMKQYRGPFDEDSSDPDIEDDIDDEDQGDLASQPPTPTAIRQRTAQSFSATATPAKNSNSSARFGRKLSTRRVKLFSVQAFKSRENELLNLLSPVLLENSVDVWLDALLRESQRSVQWSSLRACATFSEQHRASWMFTNITQATTVAMRAIWTRDITTALDSVDRGNATAVADTARQHQAGLTELIEIVSDGSLSSLKRKAVITWITIAVHQRDVLSELQESLDGADAGSNTHYIWQRELRFYVQQQSASAPSSRRLVSVPTRSASSTRATAAAAAARSFNQQSRRLQHQQSSISSSSLTPHLSHQQQQQQNQSPNPYSDAEIICNISNVSFRYSGEYHGACGCLVFTPLTSRCYLTLAQALSMFMGGAPAGPAGTGKTETTKDMARALGLACYVFNCSNQMTHHTLANIFQGLAASGTWGCFDEFNRISIEVLSVVATQVRTVFEAVRARAPVFSLGAADVAVDDDGKPVSLPLKREVGIFITMNPGYKGRTELPANVKALFRPCAMVVPDVQQICEILLSAEGFVSAKSLAVKFARCYTYAKQQLSAQTQYDWGLRAMRAVLLVAGNAKRAVISRMMTVNDSNSRNTTARDHQKKQLLLSSPSSSSSSSSISFSLKKTTTSSFTSKSNKAELGRQQRQQQLSSNSEVTENRTEKQKQRLQQQQQQVVLTLSQEQESLIFARALYTSNLAKLHLGDIALLKRLILALFPDVSADSLVQMGDQDVDTQDLISAVQSEAKLRLISLNGEGDGMAFLRKMSQLIDALKVRHSIFVMGPPVSGKTSLWRLLACAYNSVGLKPWIQVIEPKSLTSDELYGFVHPQSHEWHDGILSKTFRNFSLSASSVASISSNHLQQQQQDNDNVNHVNHDDNDRDRDHDNDGDYRMMTTTSASFSSSSDPPPPPSHHYHPNSNNAPRWILLDGAVDPHWVETMNSVMDDNKLLTLPNNERISMTSTMRLMFEIGHLQHATPATVSRAGIVVMNEGDISWSAVKDRFIGLNADPTHRALLDALMEKHFTTALIFAQENLPRETFDWQLKSSIGGGAPNLSCASGGGGGGGASGSSKSAGAYIPSSKSVEWTRAVCSLFQGIIQQAEFRNCHPLPIEIVEPLFIWCIGNILGSTIPHVTHVAHVGTNYDQRFNFSTAFRRQFPALKYSVIESGFGAGGGQAQAPVTIFDVRPVIARVESMPEGAQPVGTIVLPWTAPPIATARNSWPSPMSPTGSKLSSPTASGTSPTLSPTNTSNNPHPPPYPRSVRGAQQQHPKAQQHHLTSSPGFNATPEFLCFRFIRWDSSPSTAFGQVTPSFSMDEAANPKKNDSSSSSYDSNAARLSSTTMMIQMMHPTTPWNYQVVPTAEAIRMNFFTQVLLAQPEVNVLLVGPPCSAKTLFARNFWMKACGKLKTRWVDGEFTSQREDLFAKACQVHPDYSSNILLSSSSHSSSIKSNRPRRVSIQSHNEKQQQHQQQNQQHQDRQQQQHRPVYKTATTRVFWFSSWAFTSTREQIQQDLESLLERRGPHSLGPSGGGGNAATSASANANNKSNSNATNSNNSLKDAATKEAPSANASASANSATATTTQQHLVLVIDDLNLPEVDEFNSSSALSFLRQLISLKSLYDKERLMSKDIHDVRVLATLDPSREGCGTIDDRLLARFIPFVLGVPQEDQSKLILYSFMTAHCTAARMKYDLVHDLPRVAALLVDVLAYLNGSFAPSEAFPQHRFTLRDITRAAESLCRALRPKTSSATSLPAATIFHTTRAVADRLGTAGFAHHVSHFVREAVLNRFADNSGAADLLELGGDAVFIPPPAAATSSNPSSSTSPPSSQNQPPHREDDAGDDDQDPDKAKKPILGCCAPLLCSVVENASNLFLAQQQHQNQQSSARSMYMATSQQQHQQQNQEYFLNKAILLDPSCVSTIVSIDTTSSGVNTNNSNTNNSKAKKIDSSSSLNSTGNSALDRVIATYSDWSSCEYRRLDSLQLLQTFIEGGLSALGHASPSSLSSPSFDSSEPPAGDGSASSSSCSSSSSFLLSNFVFFDAALMQIASCARILSSAGGHILLLGLGGSGRRYVLRLAALYLGFELVTADVSSISDEYKDLQEWKSQISQWQRRAVLKDTRMCIAVTGAENAATHNGNVILAQLHEILRNGVCFSSFSGEEKEEIVTVIQSSKGTLPTHLQTPFIDADLMPTPHDAESLVWDSFTIRSRQNLHIAVVMSLIPTKIRQLRRRFPAFTDETQLLHSHPWSKAALFNVCQNIFAKNAVMQNSLQHQQQQQQQQDEASRSRPTIGVAADDEVGDDEVFGEKVLDDEVLNISGEAVTPKISAPVQQKSASSSVVSSSSLLPFNMARAICDFLSQAHGLVVRLASSASSSTSSSSEEISSSSSSSSSMSASSRILVTPKHFLTCVRMLIKLVKQKNTDVSGQIKRLSEGLLRIDECEEQVESLKLRLLIEGDAVKHKATETAALLAVVQDEKIVVSEQHQLAELEASRTKKLVDEVTALVDDCNHELQAALPAVHAAREALNTLTKQNLTELKAMGKPPADVHAVTACVLCLTTPSGERIPKDRSWQTAKTKMMGDVGKWLKELQEFDVNNIPEQNVAAVRPTIADPTFNRAVIERKSYAAAGLCEWVINIVKYHDLHQLFVPKERRLLEARVHQEESQEKLDKVRKKLAEYKSKLDAVVERYEHAKNEQQRLQNAMKRTEAQLDRARRLVSSLGGERRRWTASRELLEKNARRVAPDMALASVFFVYAGAFNFVQRRKLWDDLVSMACGTATHHRLLKSPADVARDAPVSTRFNEADLAYWSACGLPSDTFSRQSAAIVRSNDGPFSPIVLIDPQHRASHWISETLRTAKTTTTSKQNSRKNGNSNSNNNSLVDAADQQQLLVLQPDSSNLAASLMRAIHTGKTVMVAGVSRISRTLLAILEGLAGASSTSPTSSLSTTSGEKIEAVVSIPGYSEVTLDPKFRLYIQFLDVGSSSSSSSSSSTSSSSPSSSSDISAECFTLATVVDFSATEDGFVEQLLDRALQLDRPELQIELSQLLHTMNQMTVSLRQREDDLLEQLSAAGGSILDDESLVSSLERTRSEAKYMQQTLDVSEEKRNLTTEATRLYLPVALRATTVFLRLQAMRSVDPIYSFSIDPVLEEFDRGIRLAQEELDAAVALAAAADAEAEEQQQKQQQDDEGVNEPLRLVRHHQQENDQVPPAIVVVRESDSGALPSTSSSSLSSSAVHDHDQHHRTEKFDANNNNIHRDEHRSLNVLRHSSTRPSASNLFVTVAASDHRSSSSPALSREQSRLSVNDNSSKNLNCATTLDPAAIEKRVNLMRSKVTECIYLYGARAIHSQHKLAFAASVCFSILLQNNYAHLSSGHIDALLRFPRRLDCTTVPASAQWLSLTQWQSLDGLSRVRVQTRIAANPSDDEQQASVANVSSTKDEKAENSTRSKQETSTTHSSPVLPPAQQQQQRQQQQRLQIGSLANTTNVPAAFKFPFAAVLDDIVSNARWRTWVAHSSPETEKPPGAFRNVSDVEHLLLVRCLRSDRFATALRGFVSEHLGSFAVTDEQQIDLSEILRRHHPVTPLLFVVSPGADASSLINDVASRAGYEENSGTITHISLGQGQEAKALNSLHKAFRDRSWIVLHNVHLLPSWSFKLERELARLEQESKLLPEGDSDLTRGEDEERRTQEEVDEAEKARHEQLLKQETERISANVVVASSSGNALLQRDVIGNDSFRQGHTRMSTTTTADPPAQHQRRNAPSMSEESVASSSTAQFAHPLTYAQRFPGGPQTLTVLCEADVKLLSLTENIASEGQNALNTARGNANQNSDQNQKGGMNSKKKHPGHQQHHMTTTTTSTTSGNKSDEATRQRQEGRGNTNRRGAFFPSSSSSPYLQAALANVDDPQLRTFRVFLTAEPRDQPLLGNLVTRCVKIVCEPPQGVAANFIRAYSIFNDEPWEGSTRPNELHGIIFSLCFFHSLVTERIKFGAIGWNKKYPFSIEDLKCAAEIAISASDGAGGSSTSSSLLNAGSSAGIMGGGAGGVAGGGGGGGGGRVQWAHLRFFISRIIYGGHIVDPFDLRLCSTYLDLLLSPELLESGEIVQGIPMPGRRTHSDMMALLAENFPEDEDPAMFHMHAASAARKATVESQRLASVLATVASASSWTSAATTGALLARNSQFGDEQQHQQPQQQQQPSSATSASAQTATPVALIPDDTVALLIGSVPEPLPVGVVHERFDMEGVDNVSPLQLLMLRESERMNRLTGLVRDTLESLDLAERGGRFLTEHDQDVLAALKRDVIPEAWAALWGPTARPLAAWLVLVNEAYSYLLNWCNEINIPRIICVRYLFSPAALFSALQQDAAAKLGVSLETVDLTLDVLKTSSSASTASSAAANSGGGGGQQSMSSAIRVAEVASARIREGSVIVGLTLDGAAWDSSANALCEAPSSILESMNLGLMPPIAVRGAVVSSSSAQGNSFVSRAGAGDGRHASGETVGNNRNNISNNNNNNNNTNSNASSAIPPDRPNTYFCPLYRTWKRGDSWIITLPLRTREPQSKWVLRSVALIADDHGNQ